MSDQELINRADGLQKEAHEVLKRLGLIEFLQKYSDPELVGSASYGLMVHLDIDIHCAVDSPTVKMMKEIVVGLMDFPTIQKVQFDNFRELRRDHPNERVNFPHGYYIGLRSMEPSGEWKIDIWFGEKGTMGDYDSSPLESISREQRTTILRLKESYKSGKGYKNRAIGTDFYDAVIKNNVRTLDGFEKYLKGILV